MSYLMYPNVFAKFAETRTRFGDVEVLPTPQFFYGLEEREETTVELEAGKTLIIRMLTVGEARADGMRTVFFELNGQPRQIEVADRSVKPEGRAQAQGRRLEAGRSRSPDSRCRHATACRRRRLSEARRSPCLSWKP